MEILDAGEIVVGDGGFLFCLEKRGYVKAGIWTPEVTVEHPEAGKDSLIVIADIEDFSLYFLCTTCGAGCLRDAVPF